MTFNLHCILSRTQVKLLRLGKRYSLNFENSIPAQAIDLNNVDLHAQMNHASVPIAQVIQVSQNQVVVQLFSTLPAANTTSSCRLTLVYNNTPIATSKSVVSIAPRRLKLTKRQAQPSNTDEILHSPCNAVFHNSTINDILVAETEYSSLFY